MVEHIFDRLAQAGIRLDPFLLTLFFQPTMQIFHQWATVQLMKMQSLFGCHAFLNTGCLMMIHLSQRVDDIQTFIGKMLGYIDKIASAMGKAVRQQSVELFGTVARQAIAHLDRRIETRLTPGQEASQVFTGVVAAGMEEGNLASTEDRQDTCSEDPGP